VTGPVPPASPARPGADARAHARSTTAQFGRWRWVLRSVARWLRDRATPAGRRALRSRRERYGHADPIRESPTRRRRAGETRPTIGWVAPVGDPFTARYRVTNLAAALTDRGVRAAVIRSDRFDAGRLQGCDTVVLCRTGWDANVARQVRRLRAWGTRIVFDIDDLLFDPTLLAQTVPAAGGEAARLDLITRLRQTLDAADLVTVSTEPLEEAIAALGRPVARIPNSLGRDVLDRFHVPRVVASAPSASGVRLCYAAGTASHDADLAAIAPALARVMAAHAGVELHLVGPVRVPDTLARPAVIRHPLLPYEELLALLVTMDVVLAPLDVDSPFAQAKSELKVFEAALVGVPTIASPTRPYAAAIDDGRNGLLAVGVDGWQRALEVLVTDHDLRHRLGEEAQRTIVPRFRASTVAEHAARVLLPTARQP
jgi:hypothetical protein